MAERNEKTTQHPGSCSTYSNEFYNMNHKYRGKALIFNHQLYATALDLRPRGGTDKDCKSLVECLKKLAFCVDIFCDLKYAEIIKHIEKTAKLNHSDNDCLLIVALTHGEPGKLYAYDTHYRSEKLWLPFTEENCPTLAGKPKLFVFQACQGEDYDDGVTLTSGDNMDHIETDGWFEPDKIPVYPDFLLARSTVPGYFSWRNTTCGSWFIQTLCQELNYSATEMDILTLLTFVNQKVALNYKSSTLDEISNRKKQVPCFSSMLTRRLIFTEKPVNLSSTKSLLDYFKESTTKNNN